MFSLLNKTKAEIVEKYHSWNIFFISTNLYNNKLNKSNEEDKNYIESDAIHTCSRKFKEDVLASTFSKRININFLEFEIGVDDKVESIEELTGLPLISFGEEDTNGFYKISKATIPPHLRDFNCLSIDSYIHYFNYAKQYGSSEAKNLVIFLSHSFGAGFLPVTFHHDNNGKDEVDQKYFTTFNLKEVFKKSFDEKIDCLLALNCSIQSVETNAIFRDTVKLMVGSQQELYIETLSFKTLIHDLSNFSIKDSNYLNEGFSDEHIFSKFILNCHEIYINNKLINADYDFKPFNLALTSPPKAYNFMVNLNYFGAILNKVNGDNDIDYLRFSKFFCDDPSSSDQINIVDAKQFFDRLLDYFKGGRNTTKIALLKKIIDNLNNIVIFKLITGNSSENEYIFGDNIVTYLPNGIGIFVNKFSSTTSKEISEIYHQVFSNIFWLDYSIWIKVLQQNQTEEIEAIQSLKNSYSNLINFFKH